MCSFPVTASLVMRADSYVATTTLSGPLTISVMTTLTIMGDSTSVGDSLVKRMLAVNSVNTGSVSSEENGRSPSVQCRVCGDPLSRTLCDGASRLISMFVSAGRMLVLNTTIYVSMFTMVISSYGMWCNSIRNV